MSTVNIGDLSKVAVLAALYNSAKAQGIGLLHYDPTPMTVDEAEELLSIGDDHVQAFGPVHGDRIYFDYLKGRVMKVDLSGDELDTSGYNRDNGEGAAEFAIEILRETGKVTSDTAQEEQRANTMDAAAIVLDHIDERTTLENGVFTLGLADVADELKDAVRRAAEDPDQS